MDGQSGHSLDGGNVQRQLLRNRPILMTPTEDSSLSVNIRITINLSGLFIIKSTPVLVRLNKRDDFVDYAEIRVGRAIDLP